MKLFDLVLENTLDGAEELYVQGARAAEGAIALSDGESVSFRTYFNILSEEYARLCGIGSATLELEAEGDFRLDMFRYTSGGEKPIGSVFCSGNCSEEVPLEGKDAGYIYFTVTALGKCRVTGGRWTVQKQSEREVKIGMVICTYRRESFVETNIARIAEGLKSRPYMADKLHVFIVDNAGTLRLPESSFYTVIKNRNLGGSGGFTRGICAVCDDPSFTHFLLTDDDISFDFGVTERTLLLLSALTPEHAGATLGGAMLTLEKPWMQYECGGKYDGLRFKVINSRLDMRKPQSLLKIQRPEKPDYYGWWYCCMPVSSVKEHGLPMPFFIKGDDVEYCMRAAGEKISLSGIGVWHQDFAGKYTGTLEYYTKRNLAAVSAMRCRAGGFKPAVRFAYFMFKSLLLKNYSCAQALYEAYEDFMKGPRFFMESDPEEINAHIRALENSICDAEETERVCGGRPQVREWDPDKRSEFFRCLFLALENYLPAFMFSEKVAVTDMGNPIAADCFLHRTVVHYDKKSGRGMILSLDVKKRRELRRKTFKVFFGLLFRYGKMKKLYRAGADEMCSRKNWDRLFFAQRCD